MSIVPQHLKRPRPLAENQIKNAQAGQKTGARLKHLLVESRVRFILVSISGTEPVSDIGKSVGGIMSHIGFCLRYFPRPAKPLGDQLECLKIPIYQIYEIIFIQPTQVVLIEFKPRRPPIRRGQGPPVEQLPPIPIADPEIFQRRAFPVQMRHGNTQKHAALGAGDVIPVGIGALLEVLTLFKN
jgi:hypothetical protein